MYNITMIKKIIIILLIAFSVNAYAYGNPDFNIEADYIFYYKGMTAGIMKLKIDDQDNKIKISTTYDGNFLAELANRGFREETSYVVKKNNYLYPEKYIYKDSIESYEANFDGNSVEIISENIKSINFKASERIYDPISMLLILMSRYPDVKNKYNVISKKKLKVYDYKYKENTSIVIGDKKYSGYSAEYRSGNKTNYFFFSKEHKNLMVYTSIIKKGEEKIRIELSGIKFIN